MHRADPGDTAISPQLKRGLALAWVGIVLLVGTCIFLASWWNRRAVQGLPPGAAASQQTPTPPPGGERAPTQPGVVLITAAAPAQPSGVAGGTPALAPTPLPVMDRSFGYGIIVQATYDTDRTLDQVQQLDLGWIKQPVRWSDVEPEPGQPDWSALDAVFLSAAAHSLRVLVTVSAAPAWARSVTAGHLDGPPDDVQAYVNFVSQLIQRYQGMIHAVEVWAEMNREQEWYVAGGLSSAAYMELLVPTAQAVHQLDPGLIVISGGLNPTGIDDGMMAIDDFRYLREMIDAGLLDVVDCVGVHHKGYNLPPHLPYDAEINDPSARFRQPMDNPHHSWSFYSTLRGYRDLVAAAGRETPLCVTEFGWASGEDLPRRDVPDFVRDNTLEEQASYIVQAFDLMHDWGFVWLAMLSNLDYSPAADSGANSDLAAYYRITTPDGMPRPAFEALQAMPKRP